MQAARKAALVTDCKSAYDLLTKTAVPQCEEHRTTIECLLIRERLQANCMVRWVTSNAQLADCLTKSMDASVLRQCLKSGRYSLFDEDRILQQRSDKRQRLKWAKEVTSGKEKPETVLKCTEDECDFMGTRFSGTGRPCSQDTADTAILSRRDSGLSG